MIPPVTPGQTEDKQNMVSWKNTFSMRQISLLNLAASNMGAKNGSKGVSVNSNSFRRNAMTSPTNSLNILRRNLQSAINKDLDSVIKKYLEKFFQPAISNIRNNLGKDSVTQDHIKEVCKQMLDEAKVMYMSQGSRDSSPDSPLLRKRKEAELDDGVSLFSNSNSKRCKNLDYLNYKLPLKRDGPKWNPDRINMTTQFIMGPRANKVLGFGQTRGRLYVRHPDLLRYSGDQEDKEWLAAKNLMPPQGGKAYLMILDDIKELAESDDYRNNPNLQKHELKGFEAPPFLIDKIKFFIESVRTDKSGSNLDQGRTCSSTPPSNLGLDSAPSTPSDNTIHIESRSTSSSTITDFVGLPEMSPCSNSPGGGGQSPRSSDLLSPNMLMAIAAHSASSEGGAVMVLKENTPNDSCLSSLLAGNVSSSDNSQDF